jgi:hypothetical protein
VQFAPIGKAGGRRIVLYGPGGIGKTTLACLAPGPVAMFDLDGSLPVIWPELSETGADVRVVQATTWQGIRSALQSPGWDDIRTVVVDSATRAEELAIANTLENVPHEKGHRCKRLEDYGYGKGYQHTFETFMGLIADLDVHAQAGRNIILVCHECRASVPNPHGDDWLRYEPRLQSPGSGKASIQLRVREWADAVLFIGYDVDVKDGKGRGVGTRTCYGQELPHCMAKSRPAIDPIPVVRYDAEFWSQIIK